MNITLDGTTLDLDTLLASYQGIIRSFESPNHKSTFLFFLDTTPSKLCTELEIALSLSDSDIDISSFLDQLRKNCRAEFESSLVRKMYAPLPPGTVSVLSRLIESAITPGDCIEALNRTFLETPVDTNSMVEQIPAIARIAQFVYAAGMKFPVLPTSKDSPLISESDLDAAIAGDHSKLIRAFLWLESEQGFDFWSQPHDHAEILPILQALRKPEETATLPPDGSPYPLHLRIPLPPGDPHKLGPIFLPRDSSYFITDEFMVNAAATPQGYDYWASWKDKPLSSAVLAYLYHSYLFRCWCNGIKPWFPDSSNQSLFPAIARIDTSVLHSYQLQQENRFPLPTLKAMIEGASFSALCGFAWTNYAHSADRPGLGWSGLTGSPLPTPERWQCLYIYTLKAECPQDPNEAIQAFPAAPPWC